MAALLSECQSVGRFAEESEETAPEFPSVSAPVLERPRRGHWSHHRQYLLASLGCVVGLGNVWRFPLSLTTPSFAPPPFEPPISPSSRFPWLMYQHGGVFILVYVGLVVLLGYPLYMLETVLGQFASNGPVRIFRHMLPAFEGLGIATMVVNAFSAAMYGSLLALCIFYVLSSFESPWKTCVPYKTSLPGERQNSPVCFTITDYRRCVQGKPRERFFTKGQCYDAKNISVLIQGWEDCITSERKVEGKRRRSYDRTNDPRTWFCSFRLKAYFNATEPIDFFLSSAKMAQKLSKAQGGSNNPCEGAIYSWRRQMVAKRRLRPSAATALTETPRLFQRYSVCTNLIEDAHFPHGRWPKDMPSSERDVHHNVFTVDLAHRGKSDGGPFQARADCLAFFLNADGSQDKDQLAKALLRYCTSTWPREKPTMIDCLRKTVDGYESYASEEYLQFFAGKAFSITDIQYTFQLPCCLCVAWTFVAAAIYRGPQSLSRVSYFTVTIPFLMAVILSLISISFPGYEIGLAYFWDFEKALCKLEQPTLWIDALSQVFYSLSMGTGTAMTLSSYNRFHNDVLRDSLIVVGLDTLFSIFAGIGIFNIVGYMAHEVNTDVPTLLRGSPSGIVFIVIAQASADMPGGKVLAFIFYSMLCLLAIDTEFVLVGVLMRSIYDEFPYLRKLRLLLTILICFVLFSLSFLSVSRAGLHLIELTDWAIFGQTIPLIILTYLAAILTTYGPLNLIQDIRMMLGETKPRKGEADLFNYFIGRRMVNGWCQYYILASWILLAPLAIIALTVFHFYHTADMMAKGSDSIRGYDWRHLVFQLLIGVVAAVLAVAGLCGWNLCVRGRRCREMWRPTGQWGPADPANRTGRYACMSGSFVEPTTESGALDVDVEMLEKRPARELTLPPPPSSKRRYLPEAETPTAPYPD